jgi:peptidoglycan/LPS O-acetylase OafA/YrhL
VARRRGARLRAPGLDGVRAIAVLAVMAYHEGMLSGGFLGVDVFFVLSGFLITDLLITHRPTLREFWTRRARRLLPALAVMLVAVTAAATIIEPQAKLRLPLLAAVTYTSNWYQILHHVSYFDSFGPLPPLEHLWSLAIEEQFYLLWPLALWLFSRSQNGRAAWITVTLLGALMSAVAMAVLYQPADPSPVYYGTGTHASALLIGAAMAMAFPLARLTTTSSRWLDVAGVAGLVTLGWAFTCLSGTERAVYPAGLLLAAFAAAALVAAATSGGLLAKVTAVAPMRWIGLRSYAMYLWHWPVIAFATTLTGEPVQSPWLCAAETTITIALAAASWRFIESPVLRNGFRSACLSRYRQFLALCSRPATEVPRGIPVTIASVTMAVLAVAGYGLATPPQSPVAAGLMRQVAAGERISAASLLPAQADREVAHARQTQAARVLGAPSFCGSSSHIDGWQVSTVGDSVMLASAQALEQDMPGISIDAKVGMQMQAGVQIVEGLAASGELRHYVVVGLGTNGAITGGEIWDLRKAAGWNRELIFVNTFGPMPWATEVNDELTAATRHKRHVEVADWAAAIAPHPGLLWDDGIHPRPSGAPLYASVVANAIRQTC